MTWNPPPIYQRQLTVTDPSLSDVIDILEHKIFLELNCHGIGTIQTFDSTKQTAVISMNYQKTYFEYDPVVGSNTSKQVAYNLLVDCPVMCLSGGTTSLTFPIATGDQCLLFFNDRDIDSWVHGNPPQVPLASSRLHSFSDAIALVGLRPSTMALGSYSTTDVALNNGTTKVSVGPSLVTIQNNMTTLNTLLQSLLTTLETLTTINCVVGAPVTLAPTVITALENLGTQISGLLG